MKQIPNQFIDDDEHEKLTIFKAEHGLSWKDIMLLPIQPNVTIIIKKKED